ncbi:hypothetical protein RND81_13G011700 [Saponaria officinalis]|uniref:HAT C-terminal dimerisation domain-containing protein n=1 Tax=Saponaria officinalis TaxID=3572 RepID=A0AAW1GSR2_SAPOF
MHGSLTPKPLSSTRWESRVDTIRFQIGDIREALLEVAEIDHDSKIKSEAKSLALNELGDFEFLVSIIIWYEILSLVNEVSKHLQTKSMLIYVAISQVKALISCFEKYRENGFSKAIDIAKDIAKDIDINPVFPKRPISSLKKRFEQYEKYENIFGFIFTTDKLYSLDDSALESCCVNLQNVLKNKILLTIPITVTSAERSFSKLKLLKSYLRSTMLQDRLNGVVMIAIENGLFEKVTYAELIDDFASKNARRAIVFK